MWILTLRSPATEPHEYVLKTGRTTLGRKPDCDILIADDLASRLHAEVFCQGGTAVLTDLGSTNGTFINRERLSRPHILRHKDQIRIGQHVASIACCDEHNPQGLVAALTVTRSLTRELLLESVDHHAVLMYEVAGRLNTIIDQADALREIAELMRVTMGVDRCEVIMADSFGQLGNLGFPTSIARQVIDQQVVIMIPDLLARPDSAPFQSALLLGIRSVLCVPVILEQEVVALLYVYKVNPEAQPFDHSDVQLAVAISHQAALTIQRARLLEKARLFEQRATTDSLTGVHNRQQILELAESEFQRARRFRHTLALLMVDIDGFKQVNDTRGHAAGDHLLRAVANGIRANLREVDLVGRYGGDEFVVLLVETELEDAGRVAERIRQSIADIPQAGEHVSLNITLSVGIAPFTEFCPSLEALFSQADVALYVAKNAGKNQIVVQAEMLAVA